MTNKQARIIMMPLLFNRRHKSICSVFVPRFSRNNIIYYAKNSVFQEHLLEIFNLVNEKQKKPFVSLNDKVTEAWHLPLVV